MRLATAEEFEICEVSRANGSLILYMIYMGHNWQRRVIWPKHITDWQGLRRKKREGDDA